jgi:hypothetical protein
VQNNTSLATFPRKAIRDKSDVMMKLGNEYIEKVLLLQTPETSVASSTFYTTKIQKMLIFILLCAVVKLIFEGAVKYVVCLTTLTQ